MCHIVLLVGKTEWTCTLLRAGSALSDPDDVRWAELTVAYFIEYVKPPGGAGQYRPSVAIPGPSVRGLSVGAVEDMFLLPFLSKNKGNLTPATRRRLGASGGHKCSSDPTLVPSSAAAARTPAPARTTASASVVAVPAAAVGTATAVPAMPLRYDCGCDGDCDSDCEAATMLSRFSFNWLHTPNALPRYVQDWLQARTGEPAPRGRSTSS